MTYRQKCIYIILNCFYFVKLIMFECEIKLLNINKDDVVSKLNRIWAKQISSDLIVDIYLKAHNPKRIRWRVRCTNEWTVLTYKFKLPVWKTKNAYEFDNKLADDFVIENESRDEVVDHCRVKKRTSRTRGGYQFDMDEYIWLPPFIEIEWPNERSIFKLIKMLGRESYTQSVCGGKWVYNFYKVDYPKLTSGFIWRLLSLIRCW